MGTLRGLQEYLKTLTPGQIANTGRLEGLLSRCWSEFCGGDAERMTADKLVGRIESPTWDSPVISFRIERHGGAVMGSTRAEVQRWDVNVQDLTLTVQPVGHRQLKPMQRRLDVRPLAYEVASAIVSGKKDDRLKWRKDGGVHVLIGKVLPLGSAVTRTLAGRRERFRKASKEMLASHGWQEIQKNIYAPPAAKAKGG